MSAARARLTRAALEAQLRTRAFAPVDAHSVPLIGAEAELIPVDAGSRAVRPIVGAEPTSSLGLARAAGAGRGWREMLSAKGTPHFLLPDGGTVGFEPGGQIEYSSPPCPSASLLLERLRAATGALIAAAEPRATEMLTLGIDPVTPVDMAPMLLEAPRYRRMANYFASIGPNGARMMRQTAAFQVSVDLGPEPERLWRVLNAMAPYATAMFANSPLYAGVHTGRVSMRAHCWRTLDPARTGARATTDDPVSDYLEFALDAPAMFLGTPAEGYRTFAELLDDGVTMADWEAHLTTLFPEVRPRGTFEIRSCDAIAPEWYAAPLALFGGIAYDLAALRQADELLEGPAASLVRAGDVGLRDPGIASVARDLAILALDGCESLGAAFMGPADVERAREYFARYTDLRRAPADDLSPTVLAT